MISGQAGHLLLQQGDPEDPEECINPKSDKSNFEDENDLGILGRLWNLIGKMY